MGNSNLQRCHFGGAVVTKHEVQRRFELMKVYINGKS